jgi:hypothetical protein
MPMQIFADFRFSRHVWLAWLPATEDRGRFLVRRDTLSTLLITYRKSLFPSPPPQEDNSG